MTQPHTFQRQTILLNFTRQLTLFEEEEKEEEEEENKVENENEKKEEEIRRNRSSRSRRNRRRRRESENTIHHEISSNYKTKIRNQNEK